MYNDHVNGNHVYMPDASDIPVPAIRDALVKLMQLSAARKRAWSERDAANQAVTNAGDLDRVRLADLYLEDPEAFDANPSGELESARKAALDAQSRLEGVIAAEMRALTMLRQTVTENAEKWATWARRESAKSITKLATASRMAEAARSELDNTLGVLHMLESPESVEVHHAKGSYAFDLNPAVDELQKAAAVATAELAALS